MKLPPDRIISNRIPPNYSSHDTIELTYFFCKDVILNGIEGDFVECGIASGNNFAAMCAAGRHGWGFDSFKGIPWAGEKDEFQPGIGKKTANTGLESSGVTVHALPGVVDNLKRWGIGNYTLVEGWFQDTLPHNTIEKISVLRLDGDLYDSTMIPLVYLWPKLSKGGVLIIDDWHLLGCQTAVIDYFNTTNEWKSNTNILEQEMFPEDILEYSGVKYFRKWA